MCNREFKDSPALKRHKETHNIDRPLYTCTFKDCAKSFTKKFNLLQHIKIIHENGGTRHECKIEGCTKSYNREAVLKRHVREKHGSNINESEMELVVEDTSKHGGRPLDIYNALGIIVSDPVPINT